MVTKLIAQLNLFVFLIFICYLLLFICQHTNTKDIAGQSATFARHLNIRLLLQDTPAVAAAKAQHSALYGQIALSHAQVLMDTHIKKGAT